MSMLCATLVRRFQDVVDVPPMACLEDRPITTAKTVAEYSAMPIGQIAASTRFASARTLSKTSNDITVARRIRYGGK